MITLRPRQRLRVRWIGEEATNGLGLRVSEGSIKGKRGLHCVAQILSWKLANISERSCSSKKARTWWDSRTLAVNESEREAKSVSKNFKYVSKKESNHFFFAKEKRERWKDFLPKSTCYLEPQS